MPPALPQCVGDTARVTIEVLDGPYAGVGNQLSSCSISAPINLGNGLSGGPDGGGQWFNQDWVAIPATYFPGNGTGVFHYVVGGGGICPADTASVELTVTPASNAGQSANFSICSSDGPFNLFGLLGATAEDGGSWQYTSVVPAVTHSELYDPQVDAPGNYVYTVLGDIPAPMPQLRSWLLSRKRRMPEAMPRWRSAAMERSC